MDDAVDKAFQDGLKKAVDKYDVAGFDRLAAGRTGEEANTVRAYRALLDFETLARQERLDAKHRPKIWWMRSPYPGNFGDILTPYVLWHAFGVMPRWTPHKAADGICIGSIAKFAHKGMAVWGSGMPRTTDPMCPTANWTAVRGPLSRKVVLENGGKVPEVYGDPAVLLPELYAPPVTKRHRLGIIAHVLQEDHFRQALAKIGRDDIKLISLLSVSFAEIERVIDEIRACEEIVSTSLHGVIVAHAYGVPCQSLKMVKSGTAGDSFKMTDYKTSVGLEDSPLVVREDFADLDWLDARRCVLPPRLIDTAPLKAAFPFARRK